MGIAGTVRATMHRFRISAHSITSSYAKATNGARWTPDWPAWPSTIDYIEQYTQLS